MAEPPNLSGSAYDFGLLGSIFTFFMGSKTRQVWETMDADSLDEVELYVRLMLPTKNGYPLWQPRPDDNLPEEYKREGVRVGDVLTLNGFGGFSFLFNVCLAPEHPVNAGRVPPDFKLLSDLEDSQRMIYRQQYEPESHIASNQSHIHKAQISYDLGQSPTSTTSGFSFSATTPKGALLIFPDGGKREDHLQYHSFAVYAADCAASWYAFADHLGFGLPNDAIYLVTGIDKARSWAVASYSDGGQDRTEPVVLDFVRKPAPTADAQQPGTTSRYFFPRIDYASAKNDQVENQCGAVFLRGFKIALRPAHQERFTIAPVYHPSDAINRWILDNNSDVDVAMTHDNDWASLIREDEIEIPDDQELIRRISCTKDRKLVKSRSNNGKIFAWFVDTQKEQSALLQSQILSSKLHSRSILVSALFVTLLSALIYYFYPKP